MHEIVSVSVGGAPSLLWDEITVHASVKHAERSLALRLTDTPGAPIWPSIFSGQPLITVTTEQGDGGAGGGGGGDLLFTGFVYRRAPKLTAKEYQITISARSKGQDAIDSSVDHTKPDYVNSNVLAVAQDQDAFGIGFACDFSPDGFDRWRPNVGHTVFQSLEPLCQDEDATMAGQPDGSIKITRAGATAQPQSAPLVEGVDFESGDGEFDDSGQHSEVNAHGQSYYGSGPQSLAIKAAANNANVSRYRPVHEHHDRQTDLARIQRRALRRRNKEQGEGTRASFTTPGWRDRGGALWTPGNLVYVVSPSLMLCQYMLIETAEYKQQGRDKSGTKCTLHVVDPRAHGGSGGGVNQSGAAWGFDDSAAQP